MFQMNEGWRCVGPVGVDMWLSGTMRVPCKSCVGYVDAEQRVRSHKLSWLFMVQYTKSLLTTPSGQSGS